MKRATYITTSLSQTLAISIHALVKRATLDNVFLVINLTDFNPRPREEGDEVFNVPVIFDCNFNPRPREEGDKILSGKKSAQAISIHALVKRATYRPA